MRPLNPIPPLGIECFRPREGVDCVEMQASCDFGLMEEFPSPWGVDCVDKEGTMKDLFEKSFRPRKGVDCVGPLVRTAYRLQRFPSP